MMLIRIIVTTKSFPKVWKHPCEASQSHLRQAAAEVSKSSSAEARPIPADVVALLAGFQKFGVPFWGPHGKDNPLGSTTSFFFVEIAISYRERIRGMNAIIRSRVCFWGCLLVGRILGFPAFSQEHSSGSWGRMVPSSSCTRSPALDRNP